MPAPRRRRSGSGSSTTNDVPWPGSDSTRDLPAVGLDEARARSPARAPSPARRAPGAAVERLEDRAPARLSGMPGPWSTTRIRMRPPLDPRADRHRLVVAVAQRVLEQVRERALAAAPASARISGSSGAIDEPAPRSGGAPVSSTAARITSSSEHQSSRGSAVPACSRERSSSWSTSARQPRGSRARSSSASSIAVGRARATATTSASPAATIAVSGERRSCETERSTAVLISSLRRSALVSTTSRVSALALERGRTAAPRARARPARARTSSAADRDQQRAEPSPSGTAACRASPVHALEHARRPSRSRSASAIRLAAGAERRARLRRAEQQPRQLGREVGLAAPPLGLARRACGPARTGSRRRPRRPGTRPARPSSRRRRS